MNMLQVKNKLFSKIEKKRFTSYIVVFVLSICLFSCSSKPSYDELTDENEELRQQVEDLKRENQELQDEVDRLQEIVDNTKSEVDDLQDQISSSPHDVDMVQSEADDVEDAINQD